MSSEGFVFGSTAVGGPAQVEQPFAQESCSSDSEFGVPAQFVDAIANAFNFGEAENDLRARLHVYAQLGKQLLRAEIATGVFNLAATLELTKERRFVNDQQRLLQAMLVDLSIRLDDTFTLSNEQKVNVRLMAAEMLFKSTCINFMHMHLNVMDKLKEDAKTLRFNNIFGNLARKRYLMMVIKRICSSQRNSFREMIRDSVTGNNTKTLEDFVYDACVRFSRGDYNQVGHIATARFAILRRFAYEHLDLLDRGESEDGSDDMASADRASPSPDRSPATHAASLEEGEAKRKRKRKSAGVLRPKKGVDFWSEVEKWFVAHRTEWGAKWSTVPWKNYIHDTVDKDHEKYKAQEVFNPYMMQDISGDAGQMSAMETDGGIATASSSAGSTGLMSTLLGAFSAL
ncbi:hypothetical protein EWM64_g9369 [Hericium alpestre]|uniref:Uncharacterized protein n=1 Tax=Hericium alpestre TaxID=135208 RepID=A0A4Y9ZJM1_9AGAM|nr:hypothetical protein EWM64_g9369 [Hericium alpestre]